MGRVRLSFALLAGVLAMLAIPTAAAAPGNPVDQAGWDARKRFVTLPNGLRLAYVEMGDPDGRPVLLLHGYTDSSRSWTTLAPWLEDHRLLIPDQRGHGDSDAPACCYATASFVEDARLFLDAMEVGQAAVVGHSMGSLVAQAFAAAHPDRVTRVSLIGSTALPAVHRGAWMWTEVTALREPIASNTEFLRAWSASASPTPVDPAFVRYADADVVRVPLHVWRSVVRSLLDVPAGRFAPEVRAPVQILSGGRDEIFPAEHHRSLVAAYPGAQARVFDELGHNLLWERPDDVGPALAAFLAEEES